MRRAFERLAQALGWPFGRNARTISLLRAELEAQAAAMRRQQETFAHRRRILEKASAMARIGVWECDLDGERLTWTDGTYDLFDLPRGSALDRNEIVKYYTPKSRAALEVLRARAIAESGGFNLDVEIVTPKGNRRWIRLTATVESRDGVPARLYGIKQDITEEKLLWERTRYLAEFDVMTGLANRARFQEALAELCNQRLGGMLLLVDLDGFKEVNDSFGHAVGDECLKEAAQHLAGACAGARLVARIGGDEFAVLLGPDFDEAATASLAQAVVDALNLPVTRDGMSFTLGASVGIAAVEQSGPAELFMKADAALYAAKAGGRNTFRTFEREMMGRAPGRSALSEGYRLSA